MLHGTSKNWQPYKQRTSSWSFPIRWGTLSHHFPQHLHLGLKEPCHGSTSTSKPAVHLNKHRPWGSCRLARQLSSTSCKMGLESYGSLTVMFHWSFLRKPSAVVRPSRSFRILPAFIPSTMPSGRRRVRCRGIAPRAAEPLLSCAPIVALRCITGEHYTPQVRT